MHGAVAVSVLALLESPTPRLSENERHGPDIEYPPSLYSTRVCRLVLLLYIYRRVGHTVALVSLAGVAPRLLLFRSTSRVSSSSSAFCFFLAPSSQDETTPN